MGWGEEILDVMQFLAIEPILELKCMAYMLSNCNGGYGATSTYPSIHIHINKNK